MLEDVNGDRRLYVVQSLVQDECTLSNRIFDDYETALKYWIEARENTGCDLGIQAMRYEGNLELPECPTEFEIIRHGEQK